MSRHSQRGSAMLVTMIIISALLAGAAVLAAMSVSASRSTELTRNGLAALYCAEAGLTTARGMVPMNYGNWDAALVANCADSDCYTVIQPTWLAGPHDIDGDTIPDFELAIRDNDDEMPTPNGSDDNDEKVFIVSRCIKYVDSPREIVEMIHYKPALNPYACQGGGVNGGGNDNDQTSGDCSGN